jgi:peptide/nickel transport system substrate-binding protein
MENKFIFGGDEMRAQTMVKVKTLQRLIAILVLLAVLMTACTPQAATPTAISEAPVQETEPPVVEEEETEATAIPTEELPTPTAEPTEEPESEYMVDSLRAAIIGDESTLNPFTYVTGDPGWNILMMQYDSMLTLDLEGEPQPWLINDWSLSEDGLSYTLNLREDVTWNDGEPLTAEDVKFTWDFLTTYPVGRFARDIRGFESAEVLSDYQVVIKLAAVSPGYVRTAFADVPIIPQHIWQDVTDPQNHQFDTVTNVGTGPYLLMEYEPDQFYRFEANPNYFAGLPTVRELVLIKFADDAGAQAAFRTNEVDIIFRPIPPEQVNLLGSIDGVSIAEGPQFTTQMLIYNYDVEPFNLPEVRKAIAYAINSQDLVDTIYLGAATLGSFGWIHPDSIYYNDQVETIYDPAMAGEMLDSVDIVDSDGDGIREYNGAPLAFEMLTPNNNALRLRLAELIKEMLAEVGFNITVSSVEQTTWEEAVWPGFDINNGRNYQMSMWGWSAPVQADAFRATELVHSSLDVGFLNLTGAANEEIDRISDEMGPERDPERRADLLKELQLAIADEMPFVVLMYPDGVYAYWSNVYDNLAFIAGQGVVNKLSFLAESARP